MYAHVQACKHGCEARGCEASAPGCTSNSAEKSRPGANLAITHEAHYVVGGSVASFSATFPPGPIWQIWHIWHIKSGQEPE